MTEERPGFVAFLVEGKGAYDAFKSEPGGHRWQRVPPTEKRGRMQTSTVTVAVLPLSKSGPALRDADIEFRYTKGSGPGGQHKNKTESVVVATHTPTGTTVKIGSERSQHQNKAIALEVLAARVDEAQKAKAVGNQNAIRRDQIGSGMRGDKVRTIRTQDDRVTNELTGQTKPFRAYSRGDIWF